MRTKEEIREHQKEWYQKNREKILKKQKEYYQRPEIKARIKKYNKKYKKRNKEKRREYLQRPDIKKKHIEQMRVYRKNNLEKFKEYWKEYRKKDKYKLIKKKSYKKNKEKNREKEKRKAREFRKNYPEKVRGYFNIYTKKKRKTDRNFNIRNRLRCLFNQALKYYTKTGKIKKSDEYGINYESIIEHLKPFPEDISLYHVDHIKPLSSFNLEDPEQVRIAFTPENHQWLLVQENLIKGRKINY